ncbi:hypothetical protein N8I77_008840 [Diaporthe amygdali]|uniref:Uncharacterized protein n=1 Tax=Phomopsis amygdali TaxID=1214568 RepID=A0AAD9S8K7_PHOAM|nr:hypothetical protein N8I77_008840 [Diaporthe amygdali]
MQVKRAIVALTATSVVSAQRPTDTSICDYYTTALLKENTAANQLTVLTLLVNTVVIGNYTTPNVGVVVPGILAPGTFDGKDVNLLPYFDGSLASSNRGGSSGVAINNLDGGGAEPLKQNKPANSNTSNQYFLLTHLYAFFGSLLGCTTYGMPGFPAYDGFPSQYQVHKFMDLDHNEVSYFIQQVGLAAASFGVAKDDITAVAGSLDKLFNYKCLPPATAIKAQGPQLQSICTEETCPLADGAVCDQYEPAVEPMNATSTASPSAGGSNATATATGGAGTTSGSSATGGAGSTGASGTAGTTATSTPVQVAGASMGATINSLVGIVAIAFASLML